MDTAPSSDQPDGEMHNAVSGGLPPTPRLGDIDGVNPFSSGGSASECTGAVGERRNSSATADDSVPTARLWMEDANSSPYHTKPPRYDEEIKEEESEHTFAT